MLSFSDKPLQCAMWVFDPWSTYLVFENQLYFGTQHFELRSVDEVGDWPYPWSKTRLVFSHVPQFRFWRQFCENIFLEQEWFSCLFNQQIFIEHLLGHLQCLEGQDAFAFILSAVVRKKRGASSHYGHTSLQHVVVHTCYQILVAGPGWLAKCLAQRCSKCLALVVCSRDSPLSWSMSRYPLKAYWLQTAQGSGNLGRIAITWKSFFTWSRQHSANGIIQAAPGPVLAAATREQIDLGWFCLVS